MAQKYLKKAVKPTTEQEDDEATLGRLEAAISLDPEEESPMDLIQVYEEIGDIYFKMERNGTFEPYPSKPPEPHVDPDPEADPLIEPKHQQTSAMSLKEQFGMIHDVLNWQSTELDERSSIDPGTVSQVDPKCLPPNDVTKFFVDPERSLAGAERSSVGVKKIPKNHKTLLSNNTAESVPLDSIMVTVDHNRSLLIDPNRSSSQNKSSSIDSNQTSSSNVPMNLSSSFVPTKSFSVDPKLPLSIDPKGTQYIPTIHTSVKPITSPDDPTRSSTVEHESSSNNLMRSITADSTSSLNESVKTSPKSSAVDSLDLSVKRLGSSTDMYLKAIQLSNKAFTRQTCLNWQRLNVRINCKLARNFQEIGDYNQTLVYLEVALAICEKTSHHFLESKLPSLYYCYAHIHLLNNDIENAWLFYNVTFEMAVKVDKHLAILAMYELGKILTLVKAESRARKYFEEALKMALNYLGTLHVLTGLIYESLGLQLKKHNDLTNTMIVLEKARDIFKIVLGDDHEYTNRLRVSLNDAVTRRKKSTIYID